MSLVTCGFLYLCRKNKTLQRQIEDMKRAQSVSQKSINAEVDRAIVKMVTLTPEYSARAGPIHAMLKVTTASAVSCEEPPPMTLEICGSSVQTGLGTDEGARTEEGTDEGTDEAKMPDRMDFDDEDDDGLWDEPDPEHLNGHETPETRGTDDGSGMYDSKNIETTRGDEVI